jgi:serine/threonine protein kinase
MLSLPLPNNYILADIDPIGRGKKGVVYKAIDIVTHKVYALKYPIAMIKTIKKFQTDTPNKLNKYKNEMEEEVIIGNMMIEHFDNPMDTEIVYTITGIPILQKTFIDGPTLKETIDDNQIFFTHQHIRQELIMLFLKIADSKYVYRDLHPDNLIWNGVKWVVVDSHFPFPVRSEKEALNNIVKSHCSKLSVYYTEIKRTIFGLFGNGLYIPRYPGDTIKVMRDYIQILKSLRKLSDY